MEDGQVHYLRPFMGTMTRPKISVHPTRALYSVRMGEQGAENLASEWFPQRMGGGKRARGTEGRWFPHGKRNRLAEGAWNWWHKRGGTYAHMGEYEVGKRYNGGGIDRSNHEGAVKWGRIASKWDRIVKRGEGDDENKWDRIFKRDAEAESEEVSEMVAKGAEEREEDDNSSLYYYEEA